MMIISDGLPMKAETPPDTAAQPNRCADDSGWSELLVSNRSMNLLVPNWLAVMGAMLPALICGGGGGGGHGRRSAPAAYERLPVTAPPRAPLPPRPCRRSHGAPNWQVRREQAGLPGAARAPPASRASRGGAGLTPRPL
jgi:hypothetical protein